MKDICTIKPGDTFFLECTVTEDNGTTPLNLTGWTMPQLMPGSRQRDKWHDSAN